MDDYWSLQLADTVKEDGSFQKQFVRCNCRPWDQQRRRDQRRLRIAMRPLLKLTLGQVGITPLFTDSYSWDETKYL